MMKVFRLNECDWIAANSQEEAIEWYMNETGLDYKDAVDESFLEESDVVKEGMWSEIVFCEEEGISIEEIEREGYKQKTINGETMVYVPFKKVLEIDKRTEPYFFCSTEY